MRQALNILILLAVNFFTFTQVSVADNVQEWNIPPNVSKLFTTMRLNEKYEISFHINPFYLRGDFNGDSKPDIAVLIKEKETGKRGISVVHADKNKIHILGAGTVIGNGGDDFRWMDVWYVYSKKKVYRGASEKQPPTLRGEALYVEKSESASGLIYWNGEKYSWYQQGE